MSDPTKEKIDFEKEFKGLEVTYYDMCISESERSGLIAWAKSIAARATRREKRNDL